MNESILNTVKKMLGIEVDYDAFDTDVMININSVFMMLQQLAVGPSEGFSIKGPEETWEDFLGDRSDLQAVKSYIYLKVRMLFDPPSSSFVLDSMKNQAEELEYRLNLQAEGGQEWAEKPCSHKKHCKRTS